MWKWLILRYIRRQIIIRHIMNTTLAIMIHIIHTKYKKLWCAFIPQLALKITESRRLKHSILFDVWKLTSQQNDEKMYWTRTTYFHVHIGKIDKQKQSLAYLISMSKVSFDVNCMARQHLDRNQFGEFLIRKF